MNKALLLLLLSFPFIGLSQDELKNQDDAVWSTLSMVTFKRTFDADFGIDIEVPEVSIVAKSLQGKEIEVEGFIIPLTGKVKQSHFMLSRYPQNMCFFCGKAGPESAMQVFMKDNKKIPFQEEKIKVKGILRINETDINSLLYTLENAQIVQ